MENDSKMQNILCTEINLRCLFSGSAFRAMVSMTNKISSTHSPVPGLLQDDSKVPYCNAQHLPDEYDIDIVTGGRVYYCPHSIDLELKKLYEIVLIDDKCKWIEKMKFLYSMIVILMNLFAFLNSWKARHQPFVTSAWICVSSE